VLAEQILLFRLARSGLAAREAPDLAAAARCPASDFARDAALLALAARAEGVTRDAYDAAVDDGALVLAHTIRCAIHAVDPADLALYGRGLIADDDRELAAEIGGAVPGLLEQAGVAPSEALAEVSKAIEDALAGGVALDKNALHDALRERVRPALLPWCPSCKSHHVAGNLWRYGTRQVGAVLDAERRYVLRRRGRKPAAAEAVRRFLFFYGPSTVTDFAAWAGMTGRHARRLWKEVAGELVEVPVADGPAWLLAVDEDALDDPPEAEAGVRLLPPGDPYLQKPNRALLAPDVILRKELFRAVGSPGIVLQGGRLAGSWKAARKGRTLELTVRRLGRVARGDLEQEAAAVATLRGAADVAVVMS
jgi:hypothetical protein